jgi:tetratricopeptide (TPR) repeat protein
MWTEKWKKPGEKMTKTPPAGAPEARHPSDRRILRIIKHRAFAAVLLFLVSFSVFIPSLDNGLVWDDLKFVESWGPKLRYASLGFDTLYHSRSGEIRTGKYFRPMFFTSLVLDSRMWGSSPFGYHLTNVVMHSVSTVLLYFLILLLFKEFKRGPGESVAFLSGMLFALYPLHVESVSFISARGDLHAGMFLLLSLIFYILSNSRIYFIVFAGFFFYLAFLSKEVAFSFPLIILGLDLISGRLFNRANIVKYAVIGSLVLLYAYFRWGSLANTLTILDAGEFDETSGPLGAWKVITTFLGAYLFYAQKLLFPYDLNHFIASIPIGGVLQIIISLLLIAAVIAGFIVSMRKKENVTAFSLLWIFSTLGPAVLIAIYPLALTKFAERFLYVPSAGYCLLLGYWLVRGGRLIGREWAGLAAGGLLCVSFLIVTVKGQEVWTDEITLWEAAVRKTPDRITPRVNYGEALRKSGRVEEAILQHTGALGPEVKATDRGRGIAAGALALDYMEKGDYRSAEKYLKEARGYDPGQEGEYYFYMGYMSLKLKNSSAARGYLERAVEVKHRNPKALYLLGLVYSIQAQEQRSYDMLRLSSRSLEDALGYESGFIEARVLLARVYLALGEREKAGEQADVLLRIASDPRVLEEAQSILGAVNSSR